MSSVWTRVKHRRLVDGYVQDNGYLIKKLPYNLPVLSPELLITILTAQQLKYNFILVFTWFLTDFIIIS